MNDSSNVKPARTPRMIAAGFLLAFGASVMTVIYTGLLVEAPTTEYAAGLPVVDLTVDEAHEINLAFVSNAPHEDVRLAVDLPAGVEIVGEGGRLQFSWRTNLVAGRNLLPMELLARAPMAGQLVARLEHDGQQRVFRIFLTATSE